MAIEFQSFSETLIEITGGENPLCPLKEVAFVMGVDYQTAWGYRQGNTEPKWKDVVRLSHYLIREYGYYKLGMQPTMLTMAGKKNGKVSDDLMRLYEWGTDLHRSFPDDGPGYWNAYGKMEQEMKNLKAEGDKLK